MARNPRLLNFRFPFLGARLSRLALSSWFILLALASHAGTYQIAYELQPVPPKDGKPAVTRIQIAVSHLNGDPSIQFQMPVWSPGDYHRQDFAQYVNNATAEGAGGKLLSLAHPDRHTWEIATSGADGIKIKYELPNIPRGIFSENVKVTAAYAFYNGAGTLMYVVGHKSDPVKLSVEPLPGYKKVIVPLRLDEGDRSVKWTYSAPDYDTLADSPILTGDVATREFMVAGKPHTIAFFNDHAGVRYDEFPPLLEKIVAEEVRMMGGAPYERYVFFLDCGGPGGGLEHLNSNRIGWFPRTPVRFFGPIVAHEFFHLWNVKRIRPESLGPFDYLKLPKTRNLWFCEGVTSYYENLVPLRARLTSEREFVARLTVEISELQMNPARLRITADDSSLRVEESGNSDGFGGLSYYLKGALIGLCLDLKIRHVTRGGRSLDDVMRDLMERYALPKRGYPEDGLRDAVIRAGGAEMGAFYERLARSTEELPFAECLSYMGLRFSLGVGGSVRIDIDSNASEDARALRQSWLTGRK